MAPSSQRAGDRPISFVLNDQSTGRFTLLPLVIRPEDLSRASPSRVSATNTLGGAFIDNWGPGLSSINISGHTGWRGSPFSGLDGIALFQQLKFTVYDGWHQARQQAVANGRDPNLVQLIFSDALDGNVDVVVPNFFILKRNRGRPLLMMYHISMTVVSENAGATVAALLSQNQTSTGLESLTASLNAIIAQAASLEGFVGAALVGPMRSVMALANTALSQVLSVVSGVQGLITGAVAPLIEIANDVAQVGRNMMYAYQAVANLPVFAQQAVAATAAAFENASCVLSNVFSLSSSFPDFSDLYGASNCSSTSGGSPLSPLANENVFGLIYPPPSPIVTVTPDAQANIAAMKAADPVLSPMTQTTLATRLTSIGAGVTIA